MIIIGINPFVVQKMEICALKHGLEELINKAPTISIQDIPDGEEEA